MVQIAFFLRFKSQLQRIRPELVPRLEGTVVRAVKEAGGKISSERGLIQAVFDENSLGFWLDMLLLIETLIQALEDADSDLNGYSLLLGKTLPDTPNPLCRFLAGGKGGVFLDQSANEAMRPYIMVDEQGRWSAAVQKYGAAANKIGPFSRLKEIKIFVPTAKLDNLQKAALIEPGQRPAVFVASQSFEGKRDKLYLRVAGFSACDNNEEFPPLFVRFGSGGLNALIDCRRGYEVSESNTSPKRQAQLVDSWAGWIHSIPEEKNIYADWEFLFRQRLRDKPSPFAIHTAKRFFDRLFKSYRSLAQAENKTPVLVLENIQNAEQAAADTVIKSLGTSHNCLLLGTCTGEFADEDMEKWKPLFPQLTRINAEESNNQKLPELPLDLWEIAYACLLFGQYFPPALFPQLFEEAGKSPLMISRAFSLLYTLRVFDTPADSRPWHKHFQTLAEIALGERKDRIQAMVRSRLLAWTADRKITPCLRLLEILKGDIDDSLILRAIHGELACADEAAIESSRYNCIAEITSDPARRSLLRYVIETLLALHCGKIENIHEAFTGQFPEGASFPMLKAQALINRSLYHIGLRDTESAAEAVKEASLLCKGKGSVCLAQAYRVFALISLSRRRTGETIDYLEFSLENAVKSGWFQDIGMAAYYAASVQFLYGNISHSKNLAEKARRNFLKAGSPEWADRSRFLLGRLAFEIGSYQEAADIFEDIRQNPEVSCPPEKSALLEAWARRAQVYYQPLINSAIQSELPDAQLFEVEALCLNGDYTHAAELAGIFAAHSAGDNFLSIERADWHSGFAQCELLYFSWDDLRDRMLNAYRSIAQSRLSSAKEEALNTMQRVLHNEQFPEIDPHDIFYHYAWYRVLEQTGSSQVDISTAVSVAFKRLQSRAGRIDDMETRRQYLTQPHWNKALEKAARALKLV